MGKWEMVRLGDAATFVNGFAFKPADWTNEGLPIIRIQNLTGSSDIINYYNKSYGAQYEVHDGDILISWSASLGVYEWKKGKALLNQHIFKVVFDKLDYDKRFFMYVIAQKLDEMSSVTHGSTMKHITKKYFDAILVPYPPLPVQQQIAAVLDRASTLIEKRKAQIDKLDLLVKSQFIEMFGDPVTNPKGWEIGTIRDLVSDVKYGTSKPATENGKHIYLRMNNITYEGSMDFSSLKYIDIDKAEIEKYAVKKGDVLFNRTNSKELVGKTAVFKEDTQMIIAGYIIRVRTNEKAHPEFISAFLNSQYGKNVLLDMCKAIVGQANINAQELQDIKIPLAPITIQNEFADLIGQIEAQKSQLQKSLAKLEQNYKSLMQKCFRGEIF